MEYIEIKGARTHNLKNINVKVPKNKLTVITGLSGSGKSSLAFDTIYAEGQRRYVENMSSYAKQILGVLNKPDIDSADGLVPSIAIDQKTVARSPRSTVGTLTEIYDYLRLLFARAGEPICPECNKKMVRDSRDNIIESVKKNIKKLNEGEKFSVLAPLAYKEKNKVHNKQSLEKLKRSKFNNSRIDGKYYKKDGLDNVELDPEKPHTLEIVFYEFEIPEKLSEKDVNRAIYKTEMAINFGNGRVTVIYNSDDNNGDGSEETFSENYTCKKCATTMPQISTKLFSFNSPQGACPECHGLGRKKYVDPNQVIPNQQLTLAEGAIRPWSRMANQTSWYEKTLSQLSRRNGFDMHTPIASLSDEAKTKLLYGDGVFEGVILNLERRYVETDSEYLRNEIEKYMIEKICPECEGKRLRKEALAVKINSKNISEISNIPLDELNRSLLTIKTNKSNENIIKPIVKEISTRLDNLEQVGLNYLSLDRQADSLAGGEAQRIRLATQLNGTLSGILYVLDEPSIGLHPSDVDRLIKTLIKLRDQGNTLIIVEHDAKIMEAADHIIDIGPLAGEKGGRVVAEGTIGQIAKNKDSLTSAYLNGEKNIAVPKKRRPVDKKTSIKITGAKEFNLKNINVDIPLKTFVCITGVSGSGKSSLMYEILGKKVAQYFHGAQTPPGKHKNISGLHHLNKAINIDQTPIGRTPRSNLATYTGIFGPIRTLFASQPEAKEKKFTASHFSFNLKGGRCEACHGDGSIKVEMHFLPDVYVTCEDCGGKRYNSEALEITVRDKTIADILEMTVDAAADFFKDEPQILDKLRILQAVGLGYVPLGQSATTLSGGEAQRIKLATELSRSDTGRTLYILDEPTTGLHFEDVSMLLSVLQRLADKGNTVLVIEHNLDVIKSSDWIIDMGPGGGKNGGEIVASGTPEEVAKNTKSLTGLQLKPILKK